MKAELVQAAGRVFGSVAEELAFLFVTPAASDEPPDEPLLEAAAGFRGSHAGRVTLVVPASLAAEVAGNLLGLDSAETVDETQAEDALGELANVFTGHLATALWGGRALVNLDPPVVSPADPERWRELVGVGARVWAADDRPLALHVWLLQE
jgi:hypothetical protein